MSQPFKIKCNSVSYRQGFIESSPAIHPGCVNLETWEVSPPVDIAKSDLQSVPDDRITANTEIELTVDEAHALGNALIAAANATASATTGSS